MVESKVPDQPEAEVVVKKSLEKEDPFKKTLGMMLFKDLLCGLILVFGFMSLIMLPIMNINSRSMAYGDSSVLRPINLSLGNQGYSSTQCQLAPFNFGKIGLQCPQGTIGKIVDRGVGINENELAVKDFCQVTTPKIL